MQSIHDLSQSQLFFELDEKLRQMGISDDSIRALIDDLRAEDLFRTHNTHTLKTDLRRKTVFKILSVFDQYKEVHAHAETENIFQDVWDGENVTGNTLKKDGSLGLILYQNAFEVVNPWVREKKTQSTCYVSFPGRHFALQ